MTWARLNNGVVTQVIWISPAIYYPNEVEQFVECPENVALGWTYDGTTFSPPVIVITRNDFMNELRNRISSRAEQRLEDFLDLLLASTSPQASTIPEFIAIMDNATWPDEY